MTLTLDTRDVANSISIKVGSANPRHVFVTVYDNGTKAGELTLTHGGFKLLAHLLNPEQDIQKVYTGLEIGKGRVSL